MAISYQDPNEKKIIRQPLLRRIRAYYRSPRKSNQENLFYQKMYIDIHRIYMELELINTKIFNKVKILMGVETSTVHQIDSQANSPYYGAKYYDLTKESISFFHAGADATPSTTDQISNLYTTSSVAAKLVNLNFKINQLERRVR